MEEGVVKTLGFDVGEKILIPYLLNQKIKVIDHMIVSHTDFDHIGGLFTVLEKLKVNNIIIGKQFEMTDNYKKLIEIINKKKIKVYTAEAGQRIKIERNIYIDVLWPSKANVISENNINNNSLVFKFIYKSFSILFTGDIEEIAERELLDKYKNNVDIFKATILKSPHHRFKNINYRRTFKSGKS